MRGNRRQLGTRHFCAAAFLALLALSIPPDSMAQQPADLLERTSDRVAKFLDQFSDVKCTEQVTQEKFKPDGKLALKEESTFDYLVILTNSNGELSLNESRLPVRQGKADKNKNISMLVSNGFATLFLVFHPYYFRSFEFSDAGPDTLDGRAVEKVVFHHVSGMRSPAALALRGREFPLELAGTAWIDAKTAQLERIEAGVNQGLEDIGMKSLHSEISFAPVAFRDAKENYWFPSIATVEVETPRQHWRNTHRFTDYKQFSVSTEEKVADNER
ncbi:MAG TPA: hypothetical protein VFA89_14250 [Terriglobales bacterium]|nr:hypothetical protein [Terriglobales bacterium]